MKTYTCKSVQKSFLEEIWLDLFRSEQQDLLKDTVGVK